MIVWTPVSYNTPQNRINLLDRRTDRVDRSTAGFFPPKLKVQVSPPAPPPPLFFLVQALLHSFRAWPCFFFSFLFSHWPVFGSSHSCILYFLYFYIFIFYFYFYFYYFYYFLLFLLFYFILFYFIFINFSIWGTHATLSPQRSTRKQGLKIYMGKMSSGV